MKFLAIFLVAISLTAQQTPSTSADNQAQANQQKAQAILDKMIETLGGQAYLTLQDSQIEGRTGRFYHGTSEGGAQYWRFWQWPDKERLEFTKQRDIVDLYVGDSLWETTFRGTRQVDIQKDQDLRLFIERRHRSLEIILRRWLKEPGTALFYEGPTLAENHSTERVTIMNAANDAVTLYVDSNSHLPVKKIFILRDPQTRDRDEIAEVYDNWKKVQGINTPYNTLVMRNGELQRQYFVSTISYNNNLADSLFTPRTTDFGKK